MAHPFDLDRLELTGEAFPVAQGVRGPRPSFSISMNGSLAYLAVAPGLESQLAWFDRTGQQRSEASPTGEYSRMHLSPDGKQVVFDRVDGRLAPDIFLLDFEKGSPSLFVSGAAADFAPVWSPDGRTIAFASSREPTGNASPTNITAGNLYQRAVGVVGEDKVLFKSTAGKIPTDWSRDGRYLTYSSLDDVWALPLPVSDDTKPLRVTDTPFVESGAKFSPDGSWIAYQTNESGAQEVYIQSFPEPGRKQKVSANGGALPRWSRDSKELFYIATDLRLMSVSITSVGAVGTPATLFQSRVLQVNQDYDVTTDGRFLVNIPSTGQTPVPITVIVNWAAALKK
jgi:eukaryotic-like serine/threonine-protein kinase